MVWDFKFYVTGRYSFIFCFWGECQLGCSLQCICPLVTYFYSFFLYKCLLCRVLLRGLVYSLVVCTTWAGAPLALVPWRGGAVFYVGFIFYFSGGHQSGCSLQYIMVLIIFILVFIFTCSFLLGRGFFRSGCGSFPRSITQPLCCGNFREIKFFWATRRLWTLIKKISYWGKLFIFYHFTCGC